LQRRLMALSRAHDLAHGWAQRPEARPGAIPLRGLISELLRPYAGHEQPRVAIEGEDPAIPTALVTPLTLVFHELATNAAKYGALAARDGAIVLDIRTRGEDLEIRWKERMAALPLPRESRGGFGSRLLAKVVEGQLGGRLSRTWESDGMCLILSLPLGRLEHSSANAWP